MACSVFCVYLRVIRNASGFRVAPNKSGENRTPPRCQGEAMAWEQNLKEPILETLVRELLLLRRLQGRDLEKPFGPHMVACARQFLDEYLKLGVFGGAPCAPPNGLSTRCRRRP